MKTLSFVTDDPLSIYDDVVASKQQVRERHRLEKLRPQIKLAYARYQRWKPELHRLRALDAKLSGRDRKVLLGCYTGARLDPRSNNPRDKLYARIRALASVCPYCTIAPTKTLDHYLPKATYPEFAILAINLVPSCASCNSPRDFRTSKGERALIHPYFDAIPTERLLVATVRMSRGQADIEFKVDASRAKDAVFAQLYRRHFALLRLKDRYRRWALTEYGLSSILSPTAEWARGRPRDEVRLVLEEQAAKDEVGLGANHFRVVLYRAAAASDEFLDHCLGGTP